MNGQSMNLLTQCVEDLNTTTTTEDFILRSGYNEAAYPPQVYLPPIETYPLSTNPGLFNGPFKCDKCPAVFMLEVFFHLHAKKHAEPEKTARNQSRTPKAKKSKKRSKKKTNKPQQGTYCRRCGISASTFEELLRHMSQHTSSKEPNQCGNCDYETMNRGNFKRHVMTHVNIRPFKCHLCPFSASQKTHLTKHIRYHCGNRVYKCEQCSYNCSDKANFNRHKNLHSLRTEGYNNGTDTKTNDGSQNCNQRSTNNLAHLSNSTAAACSTPRPANDIKTPSSLTDHTNQVVAMTTADVAMAADIAMTTRDVMSRSLDITKLFRACRS